MSLNECQQQDWYGSEVSPDLPGPYSEAFDSLQQTAPNDKEEEALTYRDDAISFGMEFLESGERPEEVLRRIETILVQLVDGISHGFVPDLAVVRSLNSLSSRTILFTSTDLEHTAVEFTCRPWSTSFSPDQPERNAFAVPNVACAPQSLAWTADHLYNCYKSHWQLLRAYQLE